MFSNGQCLKTYAVTKEPTNGEYTLYCVHLKTFSEVTLQKIVDGKSTKYINLGRFSDLQSAINSAIQKGYSPLKVIE